MQTYVDQQLRRWYLVQLAILFGAILVRLLLIGEGSSLLGPILLLWGLGAILPVYERKMAADEWPRFRRFNHYFQVIIQMTFLPLLLANVALMMVTYFGLNEQGVVAMAFAYLIIMWIPVGYVLLGPIQNLIGRILLLISVVFSGVVAAHSMFIIMPTLTMPASFKMVGDSGVLGAVAFVLMLGVVMQAWGYRWPTWRLNREASWPVLTLIAVLAIAFVIWNAFGAGTNLATLFTKYQFSLRSPTVKMFLSGLEPGIAEEWLYRFGILALLLGYFKHHRYQIDWAVGLSSLLFGLWHVSNIIAGQAVSATLEQMVFAASLGGFLATSYLYTGSFLVPIAIHTLTDSLSMMASGTETMARPDLFEWESMGLLVLIFGCITIFLLTGARRHVIQNHVNRYLR
ncbi:CPBP family intramembrane glutamic endopeptidase [Lactiplantibacillus daowaiensis]|uniref:CPBP family intramembrane glutamic endopeptidase n=1 Tax=Lactiplantibacillus daowaiensis TaxID=2559918 RepID=A0ABW1RYB3_9LACO|nr:CPBP family intramembrane glutamic endopeptidase [Lactiplantibacillus daowaiensis]